jgi:NADPH:quinone reductase-like Zn-dependent oxidoreductase
MTPPQLPLTLGMDFSGVIEKVREDDVSSSDLKEGDEVYKDNE